MTENNGPKMAFLATLESVQAQAVKIDRYAGAKGGGIKIVATIERPKPPRAQRYGPDLAIKALADGDDAKSEEIERWTAAQWAVGILELRDAAANADTASKAHGRVSYPKDATKDEKDELRDAHKAVGIDLRLVAGEAKRAREQAERHEAALREYEAEMALFPERIRAFGALAGLGALLQGAAVHIELTPDRESVEQMLPGFDPVGLLSAGGG